MLKVEFKNKIKEVEKMSEKVESLVVFMYNIFDFFSDEHYI